MLRSWQFNVLLLLGFAACVLVLGNSYLFLQNRDVQAEIGSRQQYLQQTVGLESLHRDIAKALAELAVKNDDPQLINMLSAQGINVSVTPPSAQAAAVQAGKR